MYQKSSKELPLDQSEILENIIFPGPEKACLGIIVTPVCEIAQGKVDYITLCLVVPAFDALDVFLEENWEQKLGIKKGTNLSAGKRADLLRGRLSPIFRNQMVRYQWLDPFPGEKEPHIVDFQILANIPFSTAKLAKRKCALRSPWREAIPTRYAAYAGRVGLPERELENLEKQVDPWLSSRFPSK